MFKDIPGWEGYYQVSDDGNVRSVDRYVMRNGVKMKLKGLDLTPQSDTRGYLSIGLYRDNTCYNYSVHRLVLMTFNPVDGFENLQVNHINGNKSDNRLSNLEWSTPKENQQHAINHGLRKGMTHSQMVNMAQASSKVRTMKIRCLTTGKVYNSTSEASMDLGISISSIYESIRDGRIHNGYQFERISKPKRIVDIIPVDPELSIRKKSCPVLCLETGQIFHSRGAAARELNISESSVYDSLRDGRQHSGYTFQNYI